MASHIPDRPVTYDEWRGLPETNLPVDVVDGVLIMSPAPTGLHQLVLDNLFALFLDAVRPVTDQPSPPATGCCGTCRCSCGNRT